jgi:hypothetical protein
MWGIHSRLIVNIFGRRWRYMRKRNGPVGNGWLEPIRCMVNEEDSSTGWFREGMKHLPMKERDKDIYGGLADNCQRVGVTGIVDN